MSVSLLFSSDKLADEVKESIKSIIINGQNINKDDYPAGMPGGMLIQEKDIEEVSNYLLSGMEDEQPISFATCSACHGSNGEGISYVAPNIQYYAIKTYWSLGAKKGDADSQYNLGVMYSTGEVVKQDLKKAFNLFTQASEQGHLLSYINLGNMYSKGEGTKQDLNKALELYKIASQNGLAHGDYHLGLMYLNGKAVNQDYKEAFKYFTLASNKELSNAHLNLGIMYEQGMGTSKSIKKAMHLYKKACDNNIQTGCNYYNELKDAGY
jgi:TPR repeat protein